MSVADVYPAPEMGQSLELGELATALAKAQAEIRTAAKGSENPHFKSRYADLASVWDACRDALTKHGLAVVQQPCGEGQRIGVTTKLLHSSGQYMASTIYALSRDAGPQAISSVVTYLRRMSLAAVAGVAPADEDDDGEAAESRPAPANDNAKSARRAAPPRAPDGPPVSSPPGPSLAAQRKYRRLTEQLGISGEEARARVCTLLGRDVRGLGELSPEEMDRLIVAMEAQTNASA